MALLRTRTFFVAFGKRALWVLAALLTVALIIVARKNASDEHSRIVLSSTSPHANTEPATMQHPRYQGLDSLNRPFNIIADHATQPDSDTVILSKLSMDMLLEDGAWVAVTSDDGHYHVGTRKLELDGNVHLYYQGGYEFQSDHAAVDVGAGSAHGESLVRGQGNTGLLRSDGFTILNHGAIVWFLGHVYVKLYM